MGNPVFVSSLCVGTPVASLPDGVVVTSGLYQINSVNVIRAQTALENYYFGPGGNLTATGTFNLSLGRNALVSVSSGSFNVALGTFALENNTTGTDNMAVGAVALRNNLTGNSNLAFGPDTLINNISGSSNIAIGNAAGLGNTTGSFNTFVGWNARPLSGALVNCTALGSGASVGSSNTFVLGGVGANAVRVLAGSTTVDNYGGHFDIRYAYIARAANTPTQLFVANNTLSQTIDTGGAIDLGGYLDTFARAYSWGRIQGLASFGTGYGGYLSFMTLNTGGGMVESVRIKHDLNVVFNTAVCLSIASGANQRAGDAVLVAGIVTVANATVTANTRVFVSRKTAGGVVGPSFTYTLVAGVSFTITSNNAADTSTVSYLLIEVP